MPTVLRIDGYRIFFFGNEGHEPPHIHVEHGDRHAKFWLEPVALAQSYGFRAHELNRVRTLVVEHRDLFRDKWREYFGD